MENFNLMPQASQPVNRISTGQLPAELAELSEEALSQLGEDASKISASSYASSSCGISSSCGMIACSYDGDDAE